MWIRIYRYAEQKEILVDTDKIWKIEATYGVPHPTREKSLRMITLEQAKDNHDAIRCYKFFVGSEEIEIPANPNSSVTKYIEEIYNKAVKD